MAKKPLDQLTDHVYDGIQEYDNPLPPWWVYLFVITVIWGVAYFFYYDVTGMGKSSINEYDNELLEYQNQMASMGGGASEMSLGKDDFIPKTDDQLLAAGKQVFTRVCVSCHGQNGEGGIGPNLTDDYWIHGGDFESVTKIIFNGVPDKGMNAWKMLLNKNEIISVSNFVYHSLYGTNPPNPKAPQGVVFKRES